MNSSNLSPLTSECKPSVGDPVPIYSIAGFHRLPVIILASSKLSSLAKLLLADILNFKSLKCWKGRRTSARELGVSVNTISRAWRELEDLELVKVVGKTSPGTMIRELGETCPRIGPWSYLPLYLMGAVSARAVVVAAAIQMACGRDGWARKGYAWLCKRTGLSKGKVREALKELETGGYISRSSGIGRTSSIYTFLYHLDMEGDDGGIRPRLRDVGARLLRELVKGLKIALGRLLAGVSGVVEGDVKCVGGDSEENPPALSGGDQIIPESACAPTIDQTILGSVSTRKATEEKVPSSDLTFASDLHVAPSPPNCAPPPFPVESSAADGTSRSEEVEVWMSMRAKADELGYGPSIMTPNDIKGAQALLDAGGESGAQRMAERLAELWDVFRRRFRALESYPVPNLGAIPVISPILGALERGDEWWARPGPRVFNRNGIKLGEFDPMEAAGAPAEGW